MKDRYNEDIKELVVERLKTLPSDIKISIGSDGSFTKNELISHIEDEDEIGEKIIEIQLKYLQMIKTGALLRDE